MKIIHSKILAIDQSTKITGYSIFIDKKLDTYGLLKSNEKEKNPIERMKEMNDKMIALINNVKPDYIVFEQVQFQNNYGTFQQLSQLQGVIMAYLFNINIGFTLIEPTAWKSCCGVKGRKRIEQKANTQMFVKNTYGCDVTEDEADAIGIGHWAIKNLKQ